MTAEEIRNKKNDSDDGAWQSADWLREIAAQLAEMNEARRAREEKTDALIAEAKEKARGIAEFFDSLIEQLQPMLPKVFKFIDQVFDLPDWTPPPSAFAPPAAGQIVGALSSSAVDASAIAYLKSKGHSAEKAAQILTNHRGTVLAEMGGAVAWPVEVEDPTVTKG